MQLFFKNNVKQIYTYLLFWFSWSSIFYSCWNHGPIHADDIAYDNGRDILRL